MKNDTKTNNQSEKAYQELRRNILSRHIEPGVRIKEVHWAEKLNVNRGDIRQALAQLHSDGLVTRGAKRGFFARQYTDKDLDEIYESRLILEKGAAELVIRRATRNDIKELEKICEHMTAMAENGYEQGFNEADIHFHATLVRMSHNERLYQVYRKANVLLSGFNIRIVEGEVIPQLRKNAEEHRAMVKAIKNKQLSALLSLLEKGFHKRTV
jgi:DNA-binding GntR family transcriptional regulator